MVYRRAKEAFINEYWQYPYKLAGGALRCLTVSEMEEEFYDKKEKKAGIT